MLNFSFQVLQKICGGFVVESESTVEMKSFDFGEEHRCRETDRARSLLFTSGIGRLFPCGDRGALDTLFGSSADDREDFLSGVMAGVSACESGMEMGRSQGP